MKRAFLTLVSAVSASYWTNGNDCTKVALQWPTNQSYPIMYTVGDTTMPDAYWFQYPTSELNNLATTSNNVASVQGQTPTIIRANVDGRYTPNAGVFPPENGPLFSPECGSPLF